MGCPGKCGSTLVFHCICITNGADADIALDVWPPVLLQKDWVVSDTMWGFKKKKIALTNIRSCQCSPESDFKALLNLRSTIALPVILTGSTRQTNKQRGKYSFDSLLSIASKSDLVLWHCLDSLISLFSGEIGLSNSNRYAKKEVCEQMCRENHWVEISPLGY